MGFEIFRRQNSNVIGLRATVAPTCNIDSQMAARWRERFEREFGGERSNRSESVS